MSAPSSKVRVSQVARQVCKSCLNFIASRCPLCPSARCYQLSCQREHPWQIRAFAPSVFGAVGKADMSTRRSISCVLLAGLQSRWPEWATQAATLSWAPVAPIALVPYSLGLPSESPKTVRPSLKSQCGKTVKCDC